MIVILKLIYLYKSLLLCYKSFRFPVTLSMSVDNAKNEQES